MWGINEMQAVRAYWGDIYWGNIYRGDGSGRNFIRYPEGIVLREIKRAVYIAVELISRPTIRVVSHL